MSLLSSAIRPFSFVPELLQEVRPTLSPLPDRATFERRSNRTLTIHGRLLSLDARWPSAAKLRGTADRSFEERQRESVPLPLPFGLR